MGNKNIVEMNTDLPLENYKEDKLGRYQFASEIANGLINSFDKNNNSIVLGINGTWGSGKSTLINFIINEIKLLANIAKKEIIILRFNPWMFSGQKELQSIFLKELLIALNNKKTKIKELSKKLENLISYLNWLKYIHTGAGKAIDDAKEVLSYANGKQNLNDLKKEVDDLLIASKIKLYITIDDIDRLTPSEITDIFQLVKLNGNFANTIFILAYDQRIVKAALEKQFGSNGEKYIEKIVQIDYTIPNISPDDIKNIFVTNLKDLFDDNIISEIINENINDISSDLLISNFRSLRDIHRFTNSIKYSNEQ